MMKFKTVVLCLKLLTCLMFHVSVNLHVSAIALSINDNIKILPAQVLPQFSHMSQICCTIYKPNSYNLLVCRKI